MKKDLVQIELEKIYKKFGILRPLDVVDEARAESSPLHGYFQWDDTIAAEEFRKNQAMHLIVSVRIEDEGKKRQLFWNARIKQDDEMAQGYHDLQRVKTDQQIYEEVLKEVVKDLRYMLQKYDTIKELGALINKEAVRRIEEQLGL